MIKIKHARIMKLYDAKLISTCDTIRFCTYKRKNRNYEISVHDYTHIRYFKNKTFDSKKKKKRNVPSSSDGTRLKRGMKFSGH